MSVSFCTRGGFGFGVVVVEDGLGVVGFLDWCLKIENSLFFGEWVRVVVLLLSPRLVGGVATSLIRLLLVLSSSVGDGDPSELGLFCHTLAELGPGNEGLTWIGSEGGG